MSKQGMQNRPSPILMAAPTLLVLIGFYAFMFKGTNRLLVARRLELQQFIANKPNVDAQIQSLLETSADLSDQISALNEEQQSVHTATEQTRAAQATLGQQISSSIGQAETMNRLMHIMGAHNLAIVGNETSTTILPWIESENQELIQRLTLLSARAQANRRFTPQSDEASSSQAPDGKQFVNSQATSDSAAGTTGQPKQQYAIKFQGNFPSVKDLVSTITEEFPQATIVTVELEKINLEQNVRNWTITLLL